MADFNLQGSHALSLSESSFGSSFLCQVDNTDGVSVVVAVSQEPSKGQCWHPAFAPFHLIPAVVLARNVPWKCVCCARQHIPESRWVEGSSCLPCKTPSGHSFERSPVKQGKIWGCVAPLFHHLSCQIFKNAFCSVSRWVSGGFVSRKQAQPFQGTLSGFYLPCIFPSHLRKCKMWYLGFSWKPRSRTY